MSKTLDLPSQTSVKNHLLFIDSLRALAAIYVVFNHAVLQYYDFSISNLSGSANLSAVEKLVIALLTQSHYAVDLFIVLSGFSLMLSVVKNNYTLKGGNAVFFKRRIIRIVPPYYFAMLLSLLFIWLFIGEKTGSHWDTALPVTKFDIVTHLLFIHDFFMSSFSHINHAFWSIAVEFRIYFFFPFLVWLWRKKGPLNTLLVTIFISVSGSFLLIIADRFYPDIELAASGVSPYIILFTLGMLAADLAYSTRTTSINIRAYYTNMPRIKVLAGVIGYLFIIALIRYVFKTPVSAANRVLVKDEVIDVFMGGLAGFILFACSVSNVAADKKIGLIRMLYTPPLVFIGSFSYSLYLIHPPLLQLLSQYVLAPLPMGNFAKCMLLILIGTPLIIGAAYSFFLLFERPYLTMGKKAGVKAVELKAINEPAP